MGRREPSQQGTCDTTKLRQHLPQPEGVTLRPVHTPLTQAQETATEECREDRERKPDMAAASRGKYALNNAWSLGKVTRCDHFHHLCVGDKKQAIIHLTAMVSTRVSIRHVLEQP